MTRIELEEMCSEEGSFFCFMNLESELVEVSSTAPSTPPTEGPGRRELGFTLSTCRFQSCDPP